MHYADGHKESEEYDPRLEVSVRDKWGGGTFIIRDHLKGLDLLGMPDTSLRGLNTRTARRVRRSNSEPTVERMLRERRQRHKKSAQRAINI